MPGYQRTPGSSRILRGRRREARTLGRLLDGARDGRGAVLVLSGEPGVGKTALLDHTAELAHGLTVLRAACVESERELAYAALHQLCGPLLDRLDRLPDPQRAALRTAFGMAAGPAPDRLLVGLAVLGLLSGAATESPVLCLVDDARWLDDASARALAFAARRLRAGRVLLVIAVREPDGHLRGLPELAVAGLPDADARELLDSVIHGPLDERVRERILAETRGNPLALLEAPGGHSPAQLAGGFGHPDGAPPGQRREQRYGRQLAALPEPTRRLLQLAAADPVGDPTLVWRAAQHLGIPTDAADPATEAGLVEFGTRVRFRHPLARSAAYRSATVRQRQEAHRALAEATDPGTDPDRRAWHRAQATPAPDAEVAAELEDAAGRAATRGGLAARAAFLERAASLTPDPARRTGRALAAAAAKARAGAFDAAVDLLSLAEAGPLDDLQRARIDLVHAELTSVAQHGGDATPALLRAAARLASVDADATWATYLDAMNAALSGGHLAAPAADVHAVSTAALAVPPLAPVAPVATSAPVAAAATGGAGHTAPEHLLTGLATQFADGYPAARPLLSRAVATFDRTPPEDALRWQRPAYVAAVHLWDDEAWDVLSGRHVRLARESGALGQLPLALRSRAYLKMFEGDLAEAAALVGEATAASEATDGDLAPYATLALAALRGREDEATALIETATREATARGEGFGLTATGWASAVLHNGLGRYDEALAAAERAARHPTDLGVSAWAAVELVEAATRTGSPGRAAEALRCLSEMTAAAGTEWALGVRARSRALLSDGAADKHYREAIDRLGRSRMRFDLARAHLLYGEWLRRGSRRVDARAQLRTAHEMLTAMGAGGFAERARHELLATGETVRKRTVETVAELTAQEAQIARLARDGLSNPEISTQLFISPRTVEWHLRKVFSKLGINSRRQLRQSLSAAGRRPSTA